MNEAYANQIQPKNEAQSKLNEKFKRKISDTQNLSNRDVLQKLLIQDTANNQ